MAIRHSKQNPLLFTSVTRNLKDTEGYPVMLRETIYIHRAVAAAFVRNPKPRLYNQATHIDPDRPHDNTPQNVMWTNQSFLSLRNLERNPQNRDNLKKANIESGYYKNRAGRNRKKRGLVKTQLYFEFRTNKILNNNTGKVAKQNIHSLGKVLEHYGDRLLDSKRYIFDQLTKEEREQIRALMPTNTCKRVAI